MQLNVSVDCLQLASSAVKSTEGNLSDKKLDQAAARNPDKTYDKGHIAPHPGLQLQGDADPQQQEDKARYWLMQPVYSQGYTESVKPRHIPTNTVGFDNIGIILTWSNIHADWLFALLMHTAAHAWSHVKHL